MTQYCVVETYDSVGEKIWKAHKYTFLARMGFYPIVSTALSHSSADACIENLKTILWSRGIEPKVVRVIEL